MRTKKTLQENGLNIREGADGSVIISFTRSGYVTRYFGTDIEQAYSRARNLIPELRRARPQPTFNN